MPGDKGPNMSIALELLFNTFGGYICHKTIPQISGGIIYIIIFSNISDLQTFVFYQRNPLGNTFELNAVT